LWLFSIHIVVFVTVYVTKQSSNCHNVPNWISYQPFYYLWRNQRPLLQVEHELGKTDLRFEILIYNLLREHSIINLYCKLKALNLQLICLNISKCAIVRPAFGFPPSLPHPPLLGLALNYACNTHVFTIIKNCFGNTTSTLWLWSKCELKFPEFSGYYWQ
jgi:hypothetical protein